MYTNLNIDLIWEGLVLSLKNYCPSCGAELDELGNCPICGYPNFDIDEEEH